MIDRYFKTEQIAYQLVRNYWKHDNVIIAVDFDSTIFDYHEKGDTYNRMISLLKYLSTDRDKFKLMLFSAREGEALQFAIDYCKDLGIEFTWVNDNPIMDTRKPFYNILFDDKAGLAQTYEAFLLFLKIIMEEKYLENEHGRVEETW